VRKQAVFFARRGARRESIASGNSCFWRTAPPLPGQQIFLAHGGANRFTAKSRAKFNTGNPNVDR
jgi:hypothetical protein